MPELTTEEIRERRKNAAKRLAVGSSMIGGAAIAQHEVKRHTGIKGPIHLVRDAHKTGVKPKHGKFAAGWLATRAVTATGVPIAASGVTGLVARHPKPQENIDIKRDVLRGSVNRANPRPPTIPKDRQSLKRKVTSAAPVAGGAALGGLAGRQLASRIGRNRSSKVRIAALGIGAGLGGAAGAAAAVPVTRHAVGVATSGRHTYSPKRGIHPVGKSEPYFENPWATEEAPVKHRRLKKKERTALALKRRAKYEALMTRNKTRRHAARVAMAERESVRKSQPGAIKELPRNEQQTLIRQKKKQSKYSLTSAALGLSAFGLKSPALVGAAAKRSKRLSQIKPVQRFAAKAPGADRAATNLGIASLGVGGMGSLNFARIQRAEAKADQKATGIKKAVWDEDAHQRDLDGRFKAGGRKSRLSEIRESVARTEPRMAMSMSEHEKQQALSQVKAKNLGLHSHPAANKEINRGIAWALGQARQHGWSADRTYNEFATIVDNRVMREPMRAQYEEWGEEFDPGDGMPWTESVGDAEGSDEAMRYIAAQLDDYSGFLPQHRPKGWKASLSKRAGERKPSKRDWGRSMNNNAWREHVSEKALAAYDSGRLNEYGMQQMRARGHQRKRMALKGNRNRAIEVAKTAGAQHVGKAIVPTRMFRPKPLGFGGVRASGIRRTPAGRLVSYRGSLG